MSILIQLAKYQNSMADSWNSANDVEMTQIKKENEYAKNVQRMNDESAKKYTHVIHQIKLLKKSFFDCGEKGTLN